MACVCPCPCVCACVCVRASASEGLRGLCVRAGNCGLCTRAPCACSCAPESPDVALEGALRKLAHEHLHDHLSRRHCLALRHSRMHGVDGYGRRELTAGCCSD